MNEKNDDYYEQENVIPPINYFAPYTVWNPLKMSSKLQLSDDYQICTAKDGHGFKTILSDYPLLPGNKYYIEIKIIKGTLIKIGVTKDITFLDLAFCDGDQGWAIYNGELRHNSNSTGPKYGTPLKAEDTVGIMFDSYEGTLSFTINRKEIGLAYKDIQFTQDTFYPAVAIIYKNDSFRIKTWVKED